MQAKRFDNIIILGSGSLTLKVARYLKSLERSVLLLEVPEVCQFPMGSRARRQKIPIVTIPRDEVAGFLMREARAAATTGGGASPVSPLLVLSIENLYVFPDCLVASPLIEIINYHNSLLPSHRGMNAEAWAIFEEDPHTGFTWHRVDQTIDTGDILYQETFEIGPEDTSLSLLCSASRRALQAFERFFLPYEAGCLAPFEQSCCPGSDSSHRIADRPNGSQLDTRWCVSKVSAFVRSFDYGKLNTLGRPSVLIGGEPYTWESYRIEGDIPLPCGMQTMQDPGNRCCERSCQCSIDHGSHRMELTEEGVGSVILYGLEPLGVAKPL